LKLDNNPWEDRKIPKILSGRKEKVVKELWKHISK
jgi:hypothetical protein